MTITIIGKGNVGTHLHNALEGKFNVSLVDSRTLEGLPHHSDVIILAVKDNAIREVAERVIFRSDIIAHTAGSVPASVLSGLVPQYGVIYPMQTFTKNVEMDYNSVPVFVEGNNTLAKDSLRLIALAISGNVFTVNENTRKALHLAAVFACNFTNRMVDIADQLLQPCGLDYKVMLPLLDQTIAKLKHINPLEAQTGPAARMDFPTMEEQARMLEGNRHLQDIYGEISAQIMLRKDGKL